MAAGHSKDVYEQLPHLLTLPLCSSFAGWVCEWTCFRTDNDDPNDS